MVVLGSIYKCIVGQGGPFWWIHSQLYRQVCTTCFMFVCFVFWECVCYVFCACMCMCMYVCVCVCVWVCVCTCMHMKVHIHGVWGIQWFVIYNWVYSARLYHVIIIFCMFHRLNTKIVTCSKEREPVMVQLHVVGGDLKRESNINHLKDKLWSVTSLSLMSKSFLSHTHILIHFYHTVSICMWCWCAWIGKVLTHKFPFLQHLHCIVQSIMESWSSDPQIYCWKYWP